MSAVAELEPSTATDNAEPSGPRTDTLADSVLMLLVLTVVQRLVGFGRGILFCRWIDAEELGQWDLAFGAFVLLAPLIVLGLPGCFARYVEQYRQRGQLRFFLRRVTLVTGALTLLGCGVLAGGRAWFAQLLFGRSDCAGLVLLLAVSLVAVCAFNFLTELFNGLRQYRVVTGLQFWNSLLFAVLGIGLLIGWQATAASVVIAYGGACLLTAVFSLRHLRATWHALPELAARDASLPWSKLLSFSLWIWLTNLAWNLFDLVDRYMIVHYNPVTPTEALAMLGQYHSSRIVPLLLVSVALMIGSMLTPHLSRDWELGQRAAVVRQMNLAVKLVAFLLTAAGAGVLLLSPLLFGVAFQGKFEVGAEILPATLVYCIWGGMALVAINGLWCAERGGLGSLTGLAGLVTNILLNLLLLPRFGLMGAVVATLIAKLVALLLIYTFSHWLDLRFDAGTWLISLLPLALLLGTWSAVAVLVVVAIAAVATDRLMTVGERECLVEVWSRYARRFRKAPQPELAS